MVIHVMNNLYNYFQLEVEWVFSLSLSLSLPWCVYIFRIQICRLVAYNTRSEESGE